MKNKSILIEKYIEPSDKRKIFGLIAEYWIDKYEYVHSFMDHPAVIYYDLNRKVVSQDWYKKGELHRDRDLPAEIFYCSEQITKKKWYKKGELHRDGDLPSSIEYDIYNQQVIVQEWYKKGELHRDVDLPAEIYYNSKRQITGQFWYKNGIEIKK
jgi:hypothetical protein